MRNASPCKPSGLMDGINDGFEQPANGGADAKLYNMRLQMSDGPLCSA